MTGRDQSPDRFPSHRSGDVPRGEKVKDLDRYSSFHAHREGCEIHHPELLFDCVFKGQCVVSDRIIVFGRVPVVDAINFGGF